MTTLSSRLQIKKFYCLKLRQDIFYQNHLSRNMNHGALSDHCTYYNLFQFRYWIDIKMEFVLESQCTFLLLHQRDVFNHLASSGTNGCHQFT